MLTDGQTDRQKVITIAHPEHSSGELKIVTGDWSQSNDHVAPKLYHSMGKFSKNQNIMDGWTEGWKVTWKI